MLEGMALFRANFVMVLREDRVEQRPRQATTKAKTSNNKGQDKQQQRPRQATAKAKTSNSKGQDKQQQRPRQATAKAKTSNSKGQCGDSSLRSE
jgi:hypothetical protein